MEKQTNTQTQTAKAVGKKSDGGLFEGLSVPQVAAGALAAVTSLLLSSEIGWGGSAIGVAVGSVVSTVSSQVYKKFFQKSADKIKDAVAGSGPSGTAQMPAIDEDPSGVEDPVERDFYASGATPHARAGATQQMGRPGLQSTVSHPVVNDEAILQATAETHRSSKTGTRVVSDRLEHKVQQRKKARKRSQVQKSVIVVSIVSALLAMLISAGVVSCATSGQGIGSKPAPIVKVSSSSDSHASTSSASSHEATSASSSDSSSQSSSDSSDQSTEQGVVIDESGTGDNGDSGNSGASGDSGNGSTTNGTNGSGSGSATKTPGESGSGSSNSGAGGTSGTATSKDSGTSTSGQSTASDSGTSNGGSGNSDSGSTK